MYFLRKRVAPALLILALAGCGGAAGSTATASGAASIDITASDFRFEPAALALEANRPTIITLINTGAVLHDFAIVAGPGIHPTAATESSDHSHGATSGHVAAAPGERAITTITLAAGTYEVICTVPGHADLGMRQTLTVQ